MTAPAALLDELERDALTELVNIGVSRAASNLRKMVGKEVLLSVPSIEVIDHRRAAALIHEREGEGVVAVRQDFSGAFHGRALLIFPQEHGLELARAILGQDLPEDEVISMEEEALSETGNVILNSCLATMANMLERPLAMSLPQVVRTAGNGLLETAHPTEDGLVLFLYINFSVHERSIRGYIAMVMDLVSLATLKRLVGDFIARVMRDDMDHVA